MKWVEVQIKTTTEDQELVTNMMYDLGVTGLAIEDPNDILAFQQTEGDWDFIDPELIKQDYEGVIIKAYFPSDNNLLDRIEDIRESIENPQNRTDGCLGELTLKDVYEKDWAEEWKRYYKPMRIGKRIIIKPTWEDYEEGKDDIVIELDPGMAFGTGTHETTKMCIKALEKFIDKGNTVFDIGCGSGILSIVAAKLGAKKVMAVELDELCIKICDENIGLNNVADIVEVRQGDLLEGLEGKADIIVSNIIAEAIMKMTNGIGEKLSEKGIFIASGIIEEKVDEVKDKLIKNGFKILDIEYMGEWALIVSTME